MKIIATMLLMLCAGFPQLLLAAESDTTKNAIQIENPGAELWRNVRQRDFPLPLHSQVESGEANVLINVSGESWRQYRMLSLIPIAGMAILVTLVALLLFRLLRGKIMVTAGRSDKKILRFTRNQRIAHWTTTVLFLVLALTGLSMLFGRLLLVPLIGAEGFSYIAVIGKAIHDYLGPLFAVTLIFLFFQFIRGNNFSLKQDLRWVISGGGFFGAHASTGRYNPGEKVWFWIAILAGAAIVVSGMVLDFPIFDQSRATMEFYHVIHSISAVLIIIAAIGHIYLAIFGVDGAYENMATGYCDSNWAKEHHDLWYQEMLDSGQLIPQSAEAESEPGASGSKQTA